MMNILPYVVLIVTLVLGFWLIQQSMYRNEEKKRKWELQRESQKSISPIRLRAYERLTLFLERTKPEHMLMELRQKDPEALVTWTVPQLQQYLLQTIRAEFDHNQSQQVYVSEEVWTLIVNARDQLASFIISMAGQLPRGANAQTYAATLITAFTSNGLTPTDKALEELKNEAKDLI
ncbi:MAG: hypothetical protein J6T80_01275 [Paludibacteraceae bacterium]|nr:hypothetical protein [Paludibacteraceae bacterium]